jgi:hypothetical protein
VFENHTGDEGHGMAVNQGHHIMVRGCVARHNRSHGFDVSDWPKGPPLSHHVTLQSNLAEDNGGAGFSVNSDSNHVLLRGNVAWSNGAAWAGGAFSGFICYEGCWEVRWENNVAAGNSDSGFKVLDAAGEYATPQNRRLAFVNNVTTDNGVAEWDECMGLYVSDGGWELDVRHNNWHGCDNADAVVAGLGMADDRDMAADPKAMTGREVPGRLGAGNVSVQPGFEDAAAGDFRLRAGSPMIDAGADTDRPFRGAAPDMGAFERQ